MRKLYFFISVLLSGVAAQAQLTQANHAISAGDTFTLNQCDSTGINPGGSGAGVTWNFANIPTRNITLTYTASATTNTSFPSASVTVSSGSSDNSHYNYNASAGFYHGGSIVVSPVVASLIYTSPAIVAAYPMSLNTTSTAATAGSISVTAPIPTSGTFVGTSTVTADGTGTLNLPGNNTFTNVTRVVTSQTLAFSALIGGTVTQMSYEYFQPGTKGPLVSIRTSTANVGFTSATQTVVTRIKTTPIVPVNTVSIAEANLTQESFVAFPNPAKSTFNVAGNYNGNATLLIYDATGRQVENTRLANGHAQIDVSGYSHGLYIYKVLGDNGRSLKTGKLTVSN